DLALRMASATTPLALETNRPAGSDLSEIPPIVAPTASGPQPSTMAKARLILLENVDVGPDVTLAARALGLPADQNLNDGVPSAFPDIASDTQWALPLTPLQRQPVPVTSLAAPNNPERALAQTNLAPPAAPRDSAGRADFQPPVFAAAATVAQPEALPGALPGTAAPRFAEAVTRTPTPFSAGRVTPGRVRIVAARPGTTPPPRPVELAALVPAPPSSEAPVARFDGPEATVLAGVSQAPAFDLPNISADSATARPLTGLTPTTPPITSLTGPPNPELARAQTTLIAAPLPAEAAPVAPPQAFAEARVAVARPADIPAPDTGPQQPAFAASITAAPAPFANGRVTADRVRIIAGRPSEAPPPRPVELAALTPSVEQTDAAPAPAAPEPPAAEAETPPGGTTLAALQPPTAPVEAPQPPASAAGAESEEPPEEPTAATPPPAPAQDPVSASSTAGLTRVTPGRVRVTTAAPAIVPPPRPSDALVTVLEPTAEQAEAAALAIKTEKEGDLAPSDAAPTRQTGPRIRPESIEAAARKAEEQRLAALGPTDLALTAASRPPGRPRNLRVVAPRTASVATPPRTQSQPRITARSAPQLPTVASVARAATIENVLPTREMALIGVFGTSSRRHALMRMPNGRYVKVRPGDTVRGYQVTAISADAIRLRRRGRDTLLVIPQ
ncbi:MAG: hypothetical protein AAFY59_09315, partial [Pseudomonadota bacterium]